MRESKATASCLIASGIAGNTLFRSHFCRHQEGGAGGADVGNAFPGDVVSRAVRRRTDREREAAQQRDAPVEAHQLHGDLPLVVIHGQYRVEGAIAGADENGIRRIGAGSIETTRHGSLDGRFDDLDFLAAAIAAIAGVRVDGGHRNARTGNGGGAQAAISQFQLGQNIFGRDRRGDFRQRDVRSYPGVPKTFQHIEFTRDARKTDGVGDKTDFVLVTGIYVTHRLLVERRKADGVDRSGKAFDPQKSKQYEAGVKLDLSPGRAFFSLAAFRLERFNLKMTDPEDPAFSRLSGLQRSSGVEMTLDAKPMRGLNVILNYAYMNKARIIEDNRYAGRTIANVPKHALGLFADYAFSGTLRGLSANLGVTYVDHRFITPQNNFSLPSYTLVDLGLRYAITPKIDATLNVRNLFDKTYYTGAINSTTIGVGAPRTAYAGLNMHF